MHHPPIPVEEPVPTFEGRSLPHPDEPIFDQGLAFDVDTLISRRQVLPALATVPLAPVSSRSSVAPRTGQQFRPYEQSVSNLRGVSLSSDMVFGEDGGERQIGTISGSVASGLTVDLAVPVRAA